MIAIDLSRTIGKKIKTDKSEVTDGTDNGPVRGRVVLRVRVV